MQKKSRGYHAAGLMQIGTATLILAERLQLGERAKKPPTSQRGQGLLSTGSTGRANLRGAPPLYRGRGGHAPRNRVISEAAQMGCR